MRSILALLVSTVLLGSAAAADDPRQIVGEAQKRTTVESERYAGLLQTTDASGKTSEKQWTLERLGSHGQGRTVIRFTAPADVKGVALLIVNHPDRDSDQWMYTPAIERERRIAVQDRATRFFGTDFSFEDLEERDSDQYDYALLGEEAIDGAACWKIQSTPKSSKASQYTRAILWIRKDNYATARIDSLIKDQVVRRLTNASFSNIQGVWTARDVTMADVRRGSRTRLLLDKIEYNVRLADEDFTVPALRRR